MAVEAGQPSIADGAVAAPAGALDAVAAAARALAEGTSLTETLAAVVEAATGAVGATLGMARVVDEPSGCLQARVVTTESPALAAVLQGSRLQLADVAGEADERGDLPEAVRAAAGLAGAEAVLLLPARSRGRLLGTLELMRMRPAFSEAERMVARVAADQLAAAIRSFATPSAAAVDGAERALELAGEAIAAASDEATAADEVARVALQATDASACRVWRRSGEAGELVLAAAHGPEASAPAERARALAERAFAGRRGTGVERLPGQALVSLALGQPPSYVLQLAFPAAAAPSPSVLAKLGTFGVRAAHALRASERAQTLRLELERTRALLNLVAQASEELSLSHTLQTAIERVAELLGIDRIGVYLHAEKRLFAAAGRALAGPHVPVAERLLALALGPFRGRGMLVIDDAANDPRLGGLQTEVAETGIEAAVAVLLVVPNEVVGLLAVYPPRGRVPAENELALVAALAAQVAVAVQNARLHEQATELGTELEQVLVLERQAARQLRSLYEISRSFAQSLSLKETLDAVARTVVELLDVDAAVIRMPDARGDLLVSRSVHVADVRLEESIRQVLGQPQPLAAFPAPELLAGEPLLLDAATAAGEPVHELLVPFLEKGSTAVILPIATPAELLGTVELLSLDPARPIGPETIALGLTVAAQAALAIDNARLYQHQKEFADTMQRSLLPRTEPRLPGIEVGDVYESSARVDVGGDLYDFITLDDGKLAVVLGDVTGHGVDAAADMAMAKFVFRSLAREHPRPRDFLAAANDVVCGEIAPGKFITMLYLTIDPATGLLACASAGHPQPRIVLPGTTVRALDAGGLALGIDPGQTYKEVQEALPPGGAVVLYTDGVIEARRDGELYGSDRLDAMLTELHHLPAKKLADEVLAHCRAFAGGELADDCAVVVVKRTATASG